MDDPNIKDDEIVLDGCHRGKKYQEVLKESTFCQWILNSVELNPQAPSHTKRLARHVAQKEFQLIPPESASDSESSNPGLGMDVTGEDSDQEPSKAVKRC